MLRRLPIIALAGIAALLSACRELPRPFAGGALVARAGESELRMRDLRGVVPAGMTGDDSAAFMRVYVDRWVRRQLKLREAGELFSESAADIERLVEEYRQALLIRKLDQYYVDRQIDTLFTDAEIASYYESHKSDFRLDRTLVRGCVVSLDLTSRQARKLKTLMGETSAAGRQDFDDLCEKHGFRVDDFGGQWIEFPEFLSCLPTLRTQNYDQALSAHGVQEMRDGHRIYYFRIDAVRREGEAIPLERLRPTVRRILFNRRQSEIVRRHEQELYDRAEREGELLLPAAADSLSRTMK